MTRLIDADKLKEKDMNGDIVNIFDVLEAPTVEAIPISWLVNEIHKAIAQECFQLAAYIQFIIDTWRIDNDEKGIDSSAEI